MVKWSSELFHPLNRALPLHPLEDSEETGTQTRSSRSLCTHFWLLSDYLNFVIVVKKPDSVPKSRFKEKATKQTVMIRLAILVFIYSPLHQYLCKEENTLGVEIRRNLKVICLHLQQDMMQMYLIFTFIITSHPKWWPKLDSRPAYGA